MYVLMNRELNRVVIQTKPFIILSGELQQLLLQDKPVQPVRFPRKSLKLRFLAWNYGLVIQKENKL